jgi:hypothetical protein
VEQTRTRRNRKFDGYMDGVAQFGLDRRDPCGRPATAPSGTISINRACRLAAFSMLWQPNQVATGQLGACAAREEGA